MSDVRPSVDACGGKDYPLDSCPFWNHVRRRWRRSFASPSLRCQVSDRSAMPWIVAAGVGAVALGVAVTDHISVPFEDDFKKAADRWSIDANLLLAIARVESDFNPKAVSRPNSNGTRDYGLMQINENTARHYGYDPASLVDNVPDSLTVAARYLVDLTHELGGAFTHRNLIAAYNAGAPAILARGIFNTVYVSQVAFHWTLYTLGRLFA